MKQSPNFSLRQSLKTIGVSKSNDGTCGSGRKRLTSNSDDVDVTEQLVTRQICAQNSSICPRSDCHIGHQQYREPAALQAE